MTNGTLVLQGDFSQVAGGSTAAFAPSSLHTTVLSGSAPQRLSFNDPGPSASEFRHLRIDNQAEPDTRVVATSSSGDVAPDWGVGIAAGAGGLIGAWAGASLQSRIPESRLRRLLGWLALLIAARYLYLGVASP